MKHQILLFLLVLISPFLAKAQSLKAEQEGKILDEIEAYAQDYPGVSVSISHRGKIIWNQTMGYADLAKKQPVARNTRFNIYSTSKFITGLAYLVLVDQGKIDLDTNIGTIDPALPNHYQEITVRHLLTHRSGIRHYKGRKDWINFSDLRCSDPVEAMGYFQDDPLTGDPGEQEMYTTFGMVVASHLLEKITGKPYIEAINSLVPFSDPIELDGDGVAKATPYIRKKKSFEALPNLNAACKYGGGGLIASSDQLVEAGQFLYNNRILSLASAKKLLASNWPEDTSYGTSFAMGSGIAQEGLGDGPVLYANMGGASPGGRSYLLVFADRQVAVALTTNCEGDGQKAYELASSIARIVVGLD